MYKATLSCIIFFTIFTVAAQMDVNTVQLDFAPNASYSDKYDLQNWNQNIDYYDQFLALANENGSTVRGDKYLSDDFQNGFIINRNKKSKAEGNIRYNIYEDTFELLLNADISNAKKLNKLPGVDYFLNGEKFVLIDSHLLNTDLPKNTFGYFVELVESDTNASLYKKYKLKFEVGFWADTPYHKTDDSQILDKVVFYIKIDDKFHKVVNNRKKVIEVLDKHNHKIKDYVKNKGFNFKGNDEKIERELIQVVRYYNTL